MTRRNFPFHIEIIPNFLKGHKDDFPFPSFGISVGLRLWNIVIFDIQINRTGRWESYFPGRNGKGGSGFKFQFFYKVGDKEVANFPESYGGVVHPFFYTGKSWQVPCAHFRFGKGIGGALFTNEIPPNH